MTPFSCHSEARSAEEFRAEGGHFLEASRSTDGILRFAQDDSAFCHSGANTRPPPGAETGSVFAEERRSYRSLYRRRVATTSTSGQNVGRRIPGVEGHVPAECHPTCGILRFAQDDNVGKVLRRTAFYAPWTRTVSAPSARSTASVCPGRRSLERMVLAISVSTWRCT